MAQFARGLRIAGLIAIKDVLDAVRNRVVQGISLGVLTMLLTGSVLPWLSGRKDVYRAVVYDPGRTALVSALRRIDGLQTGRALGAQGVMTAVASASTPVLGLLLPEDVEERLQNREQLAVEGLAVHWASEERVRELERVYERALTDAAQQPVQITVREQRVYPTAGGSGFPGLSSGVIVMSMLTLGMFIAPYLLFDERDTRTLCPLLASPATLGQVVAGKSAAALAYALLGGGAGLVLYQRLVVHRDVALMALLCSATVSVAVGLAVGLVVKTPHALNAGLGVAMALLLVPVLLHERLVALFPALDPVFELYPSLAVLRVVQASFAGQVIGAQLMRHVGAVVGWVAAALAVISIRVAKMTAKPETWR